MCFTYYHQPASRPWSGGNSRSNAATNKNSNSNNNISNKQYLSSVLRDQPIWRSLRFWNAAFFDAVQTERVTFFESSRSADHHHRPPSSVMISSLQQDALDDWQFQANVTFGQLGTFTYQMHSFGLPKELCLEFLRKQSTIANLTSGKSYFSFWQSKTNQLPFCRTNSSAHREHRNDVQEWCRLK